MKITSPFNALLGALLFLLLTSCLTSAQTGSAQPAGTNSGTPVQASYESSHPISKIKPELREKFLRLHSELNSLKAEVDETNTYINQKSDDIVQAININISALTILIATLTLVFIAVPVFLIWQVPKHVKNVMGKHLTTMETDLLKSVDSKMINLENSYAKDISNRMYSALGEAQRLVFMKDEIFLDYEQILFGLRRKEINMALSGLKEIVTELLSNRAERRSVALDRMENELQSIRYWSEIQPRMLEFVEEVEKFGHFHNTNRNRLNLLILKWKDETEKAGENNSS